MATQQRAEVQLRFRVMIDVGGADWAGFGDNVRRVRESVDGEQLRPILVGVLLLLALLFTMLRLSDLLGWNGSFVDVGPVVVSDACAEAGSLRSPVWECQGTVIGPSQGGVGRTLDAANIDNPAGPSRDANGDTTDDGGQAAGQASDQAVAAPGDVVVLRLPRSGLLAERPHLGFEVDAFARRSATDVAYPKSSHLSEVTRLYLSLLGRLGMVIGAAMWLFGWLLDRWEPVVDAVDAIDRTARSRPDAWQASGVLWLAIGFGLGFINIVVVERLVGSLGLV